MNLIPAAAPEPSNRNLSMIGVAAVALLALVGAGVVIAVSAGGRPQPSAAAYEPEQQYNSERINPSEDSGARGRTTSFSSFTGPNPPIPDRPRLFDQDAPLGGSSGSGNGDSLQAMPPINGIEPRPPRLVSFDFVRQRTYRDSRGRTIYVGIATIRNASTANVTDFRFEYQVGNTTYSVTPFEGSLKRFRTLDDRSIPTRGLIRCPIRIDGVRGALKYQGVLRMQAWLDSEPGTTLDEMLL